MENDALVYKTAETQGLQRLTDADRVVILKQVFNKFVTFRMPDEFEAGR